MAVTVATVVVYSKVLVEWSCLCFASLVNSAIMRPCHCFALTKLHHQKEHEIVAFMYKRVRYSIITSIRVCKRQRDRQRTAISKVQVHANILSC